jgi:molecular chaperone DnaK
VVHGDDKEAIDAAAKELSEASATLAQKLYAEQQAEEGQGEAAEQPADDAMDAEFEEVDETQKDGK